MKTTLFYFTGTGNTLQLAKDLASQLGETEIVPISSLREVPRIVTESERVGILTPLYFSGLPEIVLRFVERLECPNQRYLFALVNRGSDGVGGALRQLKRLFKRRKMKLDAGFYLLMPENYLPMFDVPSAEAQERLFQQAKTDLAAIAQSIEAEKKYFRREWLAFLYPLLYPRWIKRVKRVDEKVILDPGCSGCGLCERVCPVDNIKLIERRPHWLHHCQECLACLHHCPKQVIQHGEKTRNRTRYRHPEISVQEIIGQKGPKSEARPEGRD